MKLTKKCLSLLLGIVMIFTMTQTAYAAGGTVVDTNKSDTHKSASDEIVTALENPNGRILCVAKNGNPRVFPAGSMEGIKSCIEMGVDITTVTVQKTKDGQLVLLLGSDLKKWCVNKEDKTNATGKVSEYTLEQLQKKFRLKEGNGGIEAKATKYKIVSLKEAIGACKGKMLLMIDNGFSYANDINTLARDLEACDIIILRGAKSEGDITSFISKAGGTPICHVASTYTGDTSGSAKKFVTASLNAGAGVVELAADKSHSRIFNQSVLSKFEDSGRAFISVTKPELCGGRYDLIADWSDLIERGYSIIETDYPKELAGYIKEIETYRSELTTLIAEAQSLNLSKYTKESSKALETSLKEAEAISAIGCISLDDIDLSRYNIQESLDGLVISNGDESVHLPAWAIVLIVIASIIVLLILVILGLRTYNKIRSKKRRMEKFKDNFQNRAPTENDTLKSISGEEISLDDMEDELQKEGDSDTSEQSPLDKAATAMAEHLNSIDDDVNGSKEEISDRVESDTTTDHTKKD